MNSENEITLQDRFAAMVLNGPKKLEAELFGMKFYSSPYLKESKLMVMGYPCDPDPKNYSLLVPAH